MFAKSDFANFKVFQPRLQSILEILNYPIFAKFEVFQQTLAAVFNHTNYPIFAKFEVFQHPIAPQISCVGHIISLPSILITSVSITLLYSA
jgi:hypothetical protein